MLLKIWKRRFTSMLVVLLILAFLVTVLLKRGEHLITSANCAASANDWRLVLPAGLLPTTSLELEAMMEGTLGNAVPDTTGDFAIIRNFVTGNRPITTTFDVTLATQSDLGALHHSWELLNGWEGPLSLTVFLVRRMDVGAAYKKILVLRKCFHPIAENATFHLVYPNRNLGPAGNTSGSFAGSQPAHEITCDSIRQHNNGLSPASAKNFELGVPYPQNLLRNVARQSVKTDYVLVVDADLVTSSGVKEGFLRMMAAVQTNKTQPTPQKLAYVLPVFETRNLSHIPKTKSELMESWRSGDTRIFWGAICGWCQGNTNYTKWLESPQSEGMSSLYMLNFTKGWEPFFIGDSSAMPMFDERFRQHGGDRISQVCEMHIVGFSFEVLNNGFAVHKGWKVPGQFHATKGAEGVKNDKLYNLFKEELGIRYPDSGRMIC